MTQEDTLAGAARHFKECEQRLARQQKRVDLLEQSSHPDLTKEARVVRALLEEALLAARQRLRAERLARGLPD